MHADGLHRPAVLLEGPVIEIDIGLETPRIAADDGQHQGEIVMRGAHHRLRAAAHAHPGLERAAFEGRIHRLAAQGRAQLALPGHRLLLEQRREEIELFFEERFVLLQVVAEQRKGLGEGAAAEDDFGAAVRQGIDGGKALEDAHGIVGTEHRDGRAEADAPGARGHRRQHHLGRGHREIGAVVFAHADEVQADLVGEHGLFDQVADDLRVRQRRARRVVGHVAEGIQSEFKNGSSHGSNYKGAAPMTASWPCRAPGQRFTSLAGIDSASRAPATSTALISQIEASLLPVACLTKPTM